MQGGRYVVGFGKHAGDGVLEAQALLGALVLGNVAADAAVALEVPLGVEDRLAADREPAAAAARRRALHLEVAERLVALEARTMRGPVGFAQVRRRLVPAPATEISRGVEPGAMGEERRHEGQPELGVLLPVPVGRKLRQLAETLFAAAERIERARLQRGQPHRALERAVGKLSLDEIVVCTACDRHGTQLGASVHRQRDHRVIAGAYQRSHGLLRRRIGQMQVGDDEVVALARKSFERLSERGHKLGTALHRADRGKVLLHDHRRCPLVLDQQDANGAQHLPLRPPSHDSEDTVA